MALSPSATNPTTAEDGSNESSSSKGSTISGAAVNLANSIVGAGCIGLGGSIAESGGGASLVVMAFVAYLNKLSLDLVIDLGVRLSSTKGRNHSDDCNDYRHSPSFESVGRAALGNLGVAAVTFGKCLFSFGCLVAYIVIIKENVAPALISLTGWTLGFSNANAVALFLATFVILPMCLPRDLSALENLSKLKILAYSGIATIVIWLYYQVRWGESDNIGTASVSDTTVLDDTMIAHWFVVYPNQLLSNTGTFVFAFLAQHVVNLVFVSLRPQDRNLVAFRQVSTLGVTGAAVLMLAVGLPVYLTFWEQASTDLFLLYPDSQSKLVNVARLFLSTGVIFTYPLPLFGLRDSLVQLILPISTKNSRDRPPATSTCTATTTTTETSSNISNATVQSSGSPSHETTALLESGDGVQVRTTTFPLPALWWLETAAPENDESTSKGGLDVATAAPTLIWPLHIAFTIVLWTASVVLALYAPSLGAVLNVVGCISGSLIAFLLPGLFWIRLVGWSPLAVILCVAGAVVGCLGTYYSLMELM
jgi:amino acid permease